MHFYYWFYEDKEPIVWDIYKANDVVFQSLDIDKLTGKRVHMGHKRVLKEAIKK